MKEVRGREEGVIKSQDTVDKLEDTPIDEPIDHRERKNNKYQEIISNIWKKELKKIKERRGKEKQSIVMQISTLQMEEDDDTSKLTMFN
ncbi:hypothetical protein RclHR1_07510007 [Rhizophagus clarus]|uniref:Uncharacterized protein n=1 Tax=Rhizophagus clarus TaxID=94130 RepID=A0A2Z6RZ27_9GLOM|nr:hypothetical protein RclHR1_07510007 [Rhizophagus clarus]